MVEEKLPLSHFHGEKNWYKRKPDFSKERKRRAGRFTEAMKEKLKRAEKTGRREERS